jgi:hypothetical protein
MYMAEMVAAAVLSQKISDDLTLSRNPLLLQKNLNFLCSILSDSASSNRLAFCWI